jgi:hypothetical protein
VLQRSRPEVPPQVEPLDDPLHEVVGGGQGRTALEQEEVEVQAVLAPEVAAVHHAQVEHPRSVAPPHPRPDLGVEHLRSTAFSTASGVSVQAQSKRCLALQKCKIPMDATGWMLRFR